MYDDTRLFGTPHFIRSSGDTDIELGQKPEGAESIVLAFHCLDPGRVDYTFDGELIGSSTCNAEDTREANGGGFIGVDGGGRHTLRITADRHHDYVIWVSWATRAPKADPSPAQQEALSDGTVTEREYREGFARYSECMNAAGHPLVSVDDTDTIIDYSNPSDAVTSGEEGRCYASEFEQLDIAWQIQHEGNPD
ncbi:hypothetical protein [Agromyces sp. H66]|uniref:hypothetical protein n=1 Tax=Agromyces sp. H66 TaxID=2529859 RepID=UPI0010AA598B|nr:hypothetical protein [Agromyces sp. H66]